MKVHHPKNVPILTFHKVDPSFEWGVTRITPRRFERVLQFLVEHGYASVALSELCSSESDLPENPVVLTFDDSYDSVYTHAYPLMMKYGLRGTVFVVTGYAGALNEWDVNLGGIRFRHLSWRQIDELARSGFEMGSHTVHHPDLIKLDAACVRKELEFSKKTIEDRIQQEVQFVSFPFGRYNREVVEAARSVGYRGGCGMWMRESERESKESFVFERKAYYLFDTQCALKAKLGQNRWTKVENLKLRAINCCSYGSSLVKPPQCRFD